MKLIKAEKPPPQLKITQERRNAFMHRLDQAIVNCNRDIIFEQRCFQRTGKVSGARAKDVCFHRVGESGCKSKPMILEFVIELLESALSQAAIAFQQERTV